MAQDGPQALIFYGMAIHYYFNLTKVIKLTLIFDLPKFSKIKFILNLPKFIKLTIIFDLLKVKKMTGVSIFISPVMEGEGLQTLNLRSRYTYLSGFYRVLHRKM